VIFGETIPFSDSWVGDLYAKLAGGPLGPNFSSGQQTSPTTIQTKQGPIDLLPSVCFEDTVPSVLRGFTPPQNPSFIVNVTNDGWFGQSCAPMQHAANAKFRSVELRRPMVRSANTGLSCVVNTTGTLIDPINKQDRQILTQQGSPFIKDQLLATVRIPKEPMITLYSLGGHWFVFLSTALSVFFIILSIIKKH